MTPMPEASITLFNSTLATTIAMGVTLPRIRVHAKNGP
jgi:hypothetical protein